MTFFSQKYKVRQEMWKEFTPFFVIFTVSFKPVIMFLLFLLRLHHGIKFRLHAMLLDMQIMYAYYKLMMNNT